MATIRLYASLLAAIDGRLQSDQTGIALWNGFEDGATGLRNRVTLDWAIGIPPEFEGRKHVGTAREFSVAVLLYTHHRRAFPKDGEMTADFLAANPVVAQLRRAKLVAFEMRQPAADRAASMRAVFECGDELEGGGPSPLT